MSDPPPIRQLGVVLWTDLPTTCPGCGAAVDQAEACRAPRPACRFCRDPLPCSPSPERGVSRDGTAFVAEIRLFTKGEGGRHAPVFSNYRPDFVFGSNRVKGKLIFDIGDQMVMPGDTFGCTVELILRVAVDEGAPFEVAEAKRVVGRGIVCVVL